MFSGNRRTEYTKDNNKIRKKLIIIQKHLKKNKKI